mgnify:CR=1 FL=1
MTQPSVLTGGAPAKDRGYFLKPTVFMLAMLFEMTSTFSCWADMPEAAVRRACIA